MIDYVLYPLAYISVGVVAIAVMCAIEPPPDGARQLVWVLALFWPIVLLATLVWLLNKAILTLGVSIRAVFARKEQA